MVNRNAGRFLGRCRFFFFCFGLRVEVGRGEDGREAWGGGKGDVLNIFVAVGQGAFLLVSRCSARDGKGITKLATISVFPLFFGR